MDPTPSKGRKLYSNGGSELSLQPHRRMETIDEDEDASAVPRRRGVGFATDTIVPIVMPREVVKATLEPVREATFASEACVEAPLAKPLPQPARPFVQPPTAVVAKAAARLLTWVPMAAARPSAKPAAVAAKLKLAAPVAKRTVTGPLCPAQPRTAQALADHAARVRSARAPRAARCTF